MSASSRPATSRRFRYCPLVAALACALPGAAWAVPTDIAVTNDTEFRAALVQVEGRTTCDPNGYRINVTAGPFTVSVATALPAIGCANVEIAGNNNITIQDGSNGEVPCGLDATPSAGLTKVSGVTVRNFSYGGSGMCGKLEATGNTVTANDKGFTLNGGAIVTGNTITANPGWGIYDTGTGSTISQNTIDRNGYGIYAENAMVVDSNDITNNTNKGIYGFDSMVISNNAITGNGWNGVDVFDVATITGNLIANNGTGIDAGAGSVIKGNIVRDHMGEGTGINLYDGGTIGGSGPGEGNVVYNNFVDIYVYTGTYGGALDIVNNLVGRPDGVTPGTSNYGINVYYQAAAYNITGNVIGAHSAGPGLRINYATAAGTVSGNMIGVTTSGTAALANQGSGIELYNLSAAATLSDNVISGNANTGVDIWQSSGVVLTGNKIGSNASGTAGIGNGAGVVVSSSSNNTFDGNVVAYNNGDGVLVSSGTGNVIRGGSIHSNALKNISLNYSGGPLLNDALDADIGANSLQNHPVITSAVEDSGNTVVEFELSSAPSATFDVDIYANGAPTTPAGQTFLGRVPVTTNASGVTVPRVTATFPGSYTHITATATGVDGTSEFSTTLASLVPAASILPTSAPFGNVVVGATLTTATGVAFRSNGTGDYVIDSISQGATAPTCPGTSSPVCATGDFSCSVSCATGTLYPPLAPTAPDSCKISGLSFHPSATGAQSTTLWICDNTSANARPVTFTGTGMPHVVTASQGAHDFGNVSIGTQVASPSILVSNAGTNPPALLGTPIAAAPFSVGSNTCGSSLAPGASCNFTVVYAPTAVGPSTGTFSMTVANGSPVVVDLQGAGISTAVGQLPLPSGIDFGTAVLASAPLQHALTLQNTGNAPVTFSAITVTEPFQMSHNCPASLAPSASCNVNLSFTPLIYGNATGQLAVSSDAGSGNQVVTLLATVAGTGYSLSPWAHSFGAVPVGSTSPPRAIAVSNNGENAIPLSGFAVTGPFTIVSNDCGASLAPASFCTAELVFEPVVPGPVEGTFTAQVGLSGAPPAVATLSGTGTQQAALVLPDSIDLGTMLRTDVPRVHALELHNTGNATLTFSTGINGPFALSGDCGSSLAPSASCTLMITFTPSEIGEFSGNLDVVSNAPGGSGSIPIVARVQAQPRPDLRTDVSTVGFGDRMIGTRSAPQRVIVTNVGTVAAQLGVSAPPRDFQASSQCGTTLAPGASCATDVVFVPLAAGPRSSLLQFTSDAPGSPYSVELLGTGCRPFTMFSRSGLRPACAP